MHHYLLFFSALLLFVISLYALYISRIFTIVPFLAIFVMVNQYEYIEVQTLVNVCYCSDVTIPVGEPIRDLTLPEKVSVAFQGAGIMLGSISSAASVKGKPKIAAAAGIGAAVSVGAGTTIDSLFGNFSKPVLSDGVKVIKK